MSEQPLLLRLLLACGAIGSTVFVVTFLIDGATRPQYDPWRQFVSSLSLGERGWVQIANFLFCGTLVLCFAIALKRVFRTGKVSTWGPALIGILGLCLVGAGIFVTDPSLGYPPEAPEAKTLSGTLHQFFSANAFASLVAACFVFTRRFASDPEWRGWAAFAATTGILVIAFLLAAAWASAPGASAPAGLFQRLSITIGWAWLALFAFRLLTMSRSRSRAV